MAADELTNNGSHLDDGQGNLETRSEEGKVINDHYEENTIDREEPAAGENNVNSSIPTMLSSGKKKKKRNTRPAGQRGYDKPTGMEDFYADAPLTPEQMRELKTIYDVNLPFIDRLLIGIQRFERTRKLTPERRDILYKWLHFGGITIGPSSFGGGQDKENMDKDEIAAAASQVSIPDEIRSDLESTGSTTSKYAVDFLGCTQAFLSRPASGMFGFENKERVRILTSTIERFMDYLMQNDICPEYHLDVLNTRDFCREATELLWSIGEAHRWLPGEFNIACSTLFDGNYARDYDGETYWGEQKPGEAVFVGLTPEKATQIIGYGIVGTASDEVYQKYSELLEEGGGEALQAIEVIRDEGFEIVKIEHPTSDCKDLYTQNSVDYRPLGKVTAKSWRDPEAPPEDLTDGERKAAKQMVEKTYTFFIEEIILQHLSIGQKVLATIRKLNCDVWFFDEFIRIYPSFELFILNEMTEGYKRPKMLPDALVWEGLTDEEATRNEPVESELPEINNLKLSEVEAAKDQEQIKHEDGSADHVNIEAKDDEEPY